MKLDFESFFALLDETELLLAVVGASALIERGEPGRAVWQLMGRAARRVLAARWRTLAPASLDLSELTPETVAMLRAAAERLRVSYPALGDLISSELALVERVRTQELDA